MPINSKTNIRINLTGNSDLDRTNIFNYIIEQFTADYTEAEVLVLAATFLGQDTKTILTEIRLNPDLLVPVCLYLLKEDKIHLSRRSEIGNALVRFTEAQIRTIEAQTKKKPLFNFTNEFEETIYTKLAQQNVNEVAIKYPFFHVYYYRGLVFEQLRDYPNAFRMYSKAHQWNPFNPKAILKILEALKHDQRADDLFRLSQWYLQVVYSLPNISNALRYAGYALYLNGKFPESYAYYYQSIVYDDSVLPPNFNDEIKSVLKAMNKDEAYELTRSEIKKLFAYSKEKPFPSEVTFDAIRTMIINHYTNENYTDVLRYATHYVIYRPNDEKIARILRVSKLKLN